jgi:hypothetical protein
MKAMLGGTSEAVTRGKVDSIKSKTLGGHMLVRSPRV